MYPIVPRCRSKRLVVEVVGGRDDATFLSMKYPPRQTPRSVQKARACAIHWQVLCTVCQTEACRRQIFGQHGGHARHRRVAQSSDCQRGEARRVAIAGDTARRSAPSPPSSRTSRFSASLRCCKPFILEGVGDDWPARARWADPSYFLEHAGVDLERECTISVGAFGGGALAEEETTVGDARASSSRRADTTSDGTRTVYLNAWPYVRGGSGALQADFEVPPSRAAPPRKAEESPVARQRRRRPEVGVRRRGGQGVARTSTAT